MKAKVFFLSILMAVSAAVFAQDNQNIEFVERVHDFGQIQEDGGRVTTTFEFTNTSKKPVTLDNVQASCGCTTPQWSKEAIAPKKKGFINVTYNPAGRPGSFTKSITVKYHDASEETKTIVLNIMGEVIPKAKPAN